MRDLSEFSTFPFELPVTVRALDPPVPLEPAREGENGLDCWLPDAGRLLPVDG